MIFVSISLYKIFRGLYKRCECKRCDYLIPVVNKRGRFCKYKYKHFPKGENNPNWKGGKSKRDGYNVLNGINYHPNLTKDGVILEHIKVFTDYYQCCLLPWANIHHRNRKRDDNRIENLEGMTRWAHTKLHNPKQVFPDRTCKLCGTSDTKLNKSGTPMWYTNPLTKEKHVCAKCYYKCRYQKFRDIILIKQKPTQARWRENNKEYRRIKRRERYLKLGK